MRTILIPLVGGLAWLFASFSVASLEYEGGDVDLTPFVTIYPPAKVEIPFSNFSDLESFLVGVADIAQMRRNSPHYWVKFEPIVNRTSESSVVLVIYGSIIDQIDLHLYRHGQLLESFSGGYFSQGKELFYTFEFQLEPDVDYEILGVLKGRYLTGPLSIGLRDAAEFAKADEKRKSLVYLCIGALLVLGCYNFVLYIGIRDSSYLYYSLYLLVTTLGWAAVFNVLAYNFDMLSLGWKLVPFYLAPILNSLFLLSFLRIRKETHPRIYYPVMTLMLANLIMVCLFPFVNSYLIYYSLVIYNASIWLALSLFAGVYRLLEGFKPARFFVLGFSVMALGSVFALLPGFGIRPPFESFYLVSLVAQTIDMTLLALALADKIAVMRAEKTAALKLSLQKDVEMLAVEKASNQALQTSNQNLKSMLTIHEELERKRRNFLLLVNHELRTPVNALLDSVRAFDSKGYNNVGFENIKYGAESLAVLLDKLGVFSELSDKHAEPVLGRVSIQRLMEKLAEIGSSLTTGKPVDVACVNENVGDVLIDGFLLEAALKPVLDNACKYTQEGVVSLEFRYDLEQQILTVVLEDSGEGINQHEIQRLLSAFEQGSEGFGRQEQGLGLGLFIAGAAVKVLGGKMALYPSKKLGGVQVVLEMPCEWVVPIEEGDGVVERALVVEDNAVNAKVLMGILKSMGVDSVHAENGQVALEIVQAELFDVVFMDLQMPVMDGFEATKALKAQGYPVAIIAITANSEQEARHRCLRLGMADVLVKPVRAPDIQHSVEKLGLSLPK